MVSKVKYDFEIGDFFSLELTKKEYAYGRVLSKFDYGHVVEIYQFFGTDEVVPIDEIDTTETLFPFNIIIDSYSLFVKKKEGFWRITSFEQDFELREERKKNIRFYLGVPGNFEVIDLNRDKETVSDEEAKKYPPLGPSGDSEAKRLINFWRAKKGV